MGHRKFFIKQREYNLLLRFYDLNVRKKRHDGAAIFRS
jgi:hypothetical protein